MPTTVHPAKMNKAARIDSLTLSIVRVTPATHWAFVEIVDEENRGGFGEATLTGQHSALLHAAEEMFPALVERPLDEAANLLASLPLDTLARAAVCSALSHAVTDLRAQHRDCSVAELLGRPVRALVPMYANINRRTRSRTPECFAQSARAAVAAGFSALKIAPFDGVTFYGRHADDQQPQIAAALERIAAVRDAVGPAVELMVDCHWRLNVEVARAVLASEACDGLYWLECPLPETQEHLQDLSALRSFANRRGVRLAGCEEAIRVEGFQPFLEAGAYDVMMPDIKYVGGVEEMLDVARLLDAHGVEFSPHNPSGPIAHALSLQVCSLVPNFRRLEMQFDETPYFAALCHPKPMAVDNGRSCIAAAPGIGVGLARDVLEALTICRLRFSCAKQTGDVRTR